VHGWLVAAGIERRPPGAVAVVGDGDDPVGLYEGGWSCPTIADRVGCSPSTIYRRLEGAGVPRRSARPRASRHDLIEALDRGLSAPVIATHLGVSVSCVCRALAREQRETASGLPGNDAGSASPSSTASATPPAANVSVSGNP
jgi:transposase